jgi:hypothetical protein
MFARSMADWIKTNMPDMVAQHVVILICPLIFDLFNGIYNKRIPNTDTTIWIFTYISLLSTAELVAAIN